MNKLTVLKTRILVHFLALTLISATTILIMPQQQASATSCIPTVYDDFSMPYTSSSSGIYTTNGKWFISSVGGGTVGVLSNHTMFLKPAVATSIGVTHAPAMLTTTKYKDFTMVASITTTKQLRQNNLPNTWEVGWVLFHYVDRTHFYYYNVKTNGIEFGKYDGGTNPESQIFLQTNSLMKTVIGTPNTWEITEKGDNYSLAINGVLVASMTDHSSFSSTPGGLMFYDEDSIVNINKIYITPNCGAVSISHTDIYLWWRLATLNFS